MNLKQIIDKIYSDFTFDEKRLFKIGSFYEKDNKFIFEIYARKVKYSQEALELFINEITEIRNAEKLYIESKFKQKIFTKIAHEFKTPLLTIISLIDKINEFQLNDSEINSNIKDNLNNISNLSNYTLSLITDIVHYVSGCVNLKLNLKEIIPRDTLNFSFNVLKTLIECNENKKDRIKPILKIDGSIDKVKIVTDENRLKQIILNFISNSFKFTLCGFIKLKAKLNEIGGNIEISLKDSGIGIKNEDHDKVFQEYTNISAGEDHNLYGSGLGLSITKGLATALNYKIGFKSVFGKGSRFFIQINCIDIKRKRKTSSFFVNPMSLQLPLKEDLNDTRSIRNYQNASYLDNKKGSEKEISDIEGKRSDINYSDTNRLQYDLMRTEEMYLMVNSDSSQEVIYDKFKIIVVDDNKLVRETTVNTIKSVLFDIDYSHYEFIECYDGIDLLPLIKDDYQHKIKLIFIDENMNYLNGSDTIKIIRKLEKDKKINNYHVISISAVSDEETTKSFLKLGFDFILPKPCKKNEIKRALDVFLTPINSYVIK
jgi:signal transduction histidine kinase